MMMDDGSKTSRLFASQKRKNKASVVVLLFETMVNISANAVSVLILSSLSGGVNAFTSLKSPQQHASLLSMVSNLVGGWSIFLCLQVEAFWHGILI
jgi:hypothetical protein